MKKGNILSIIFMSFIILFSFQGITHASSNNNDDIISDLEIETMKERYQELGIDENTGEQLIEKVLNGELLDSQRTDISEEDVTFIHNEDGSEVIVFPDGSRAKVGIEPNKLNKPQSGFQTFGSSTGTVNLSCGSGTTCTAVVRYYDMIWDIKYDAKVNIFNGGSPGIVSISNFRSDAVMYNITKLSSSIIRYNATTSSPAKAKWQFKAQNKTGLYEVTRDLVLYVDKNSSVYARLEWN